MLKISEAVSTGMVANPARGCREIRFFLSLFAPENLISRDRFGLPVPRQPAHSPHSQTESGAYSSVSSRLPRRRPFIYTVNRHRASTEFTRDAVAYRYFQRAHFIPIVGVGKRGACILIGPW